MAELIGKVALVTGASRGIGRAIALGLARAGADICLGHRSRTEDAEAAAAAIREMGRRCNIVPGDISLPETVLQLVSVAERDFGQVDILVNNAGISVPKPLDEVTGEIWDETLSVNLKSCFLATQSVVPGMQRRRWGRVINVSSVAAQVGGVVGPHYAASKAGMLGLTRYYASKLAREGITVNAIAPALIETEMVTSNPNARSDLIPVGRFGLPDEVAEVAVMLAGNAYITGQTIHVNGGWYMT